MKKLSIIIVCYNSEKFIQQTLKSVSDNLPKDSEIIVLDNDSLDDTKEILENYPGITFIENGANIGFSKANNIGAKQAQGEYLLFLNPDTKIRQDAVQILLDYISRDSKVGIVAPQLLEGKKIQQSVSNFPTLWGAMQEYFLGKKKAYSQYAPNTDKEVEVKVVYGAAMLIKKDVFNPVGGFDERYFLYYEDIDLCKKISQMGLKIMYLPHAKIDHLVGQSMPPSEKLTFPFGVIAHFYPIKRSGSYYYLIQSSIIYFGLIKAFLIHMIIFLSVKLR